MAGGDQPVRSRLVPCDDFAGRRRTAIVFTDRGRIVLTAPAGEVMFLDSAEADQLRAALAGAQAELTTSEAHDDPDPKRR